MKKVCSLVCGVIFVAGIVWADSYSMTVGTNSIKVLPSRSLDFAVTYTTNTVYTQGMYVQTSPHRFYMAATAGVSGTNAPNHSQGKATDGTVSWLAVGRTKRTEASVVNDSAVVMYVSDVPPAVVGEGARLNAAGGSYDLPYSGELWAIAASGTNNNMSVIDR